MTKEQLLSIFTAYSIRINDDSKNSTEYNPVKRALLPPQKTVDYKHKFYDIAHINLLMRELSGHGPYDLYDESAQARYLVETQGRIIFAQEGKPGKAIPKHKEMASTCLAAGNVYFDESYSKIVMISHCSGDFLPKVESLTHALAAILASAPHLLGEKISLLIQGQFLGAAADVVEMQTAELVQCLIQPYPEKTLQVRQANHAWEEIRIVSLTRPSRYNLFSNVASANSEPAAAAAASSRLPLKRNLFSLDSNLDDKAKPPAKMSTGFRRALFLSPEESLKKQESNHLETLPKSQ